MCVNSVTYAFGASQKQIKKGGKRRKMKKVISILLSLSLIFSSMIMLTGTAFADVRVSIHDDEVETSSSVAVPTKSEGSKTINLTANAEELDHISFDFDGEDHGVMLTKKSPVVLVTIPPTAKEGEVKIVASQGGTSATYTLTLTKAASEATSINVQESSSMDGSYTDISDGQYFNVNRYYKALVYDQYGAEMTDANVTWTGEPNFDFTGHLHMTQTGNVVCIAPDGTPGGATLKATFGSINTSFSITVLTKDSHSLDTLTNKTYTYGDTETNSQTVFCTCDGTASYTSSNPDKVGVNSATGELTIKSVTGDDPVTITATMDGNDTHLAKTVTYTVTVNPKELEITGLTAEDRDYVEGSTTVDLTGGAITGRVAGDTELDVDVEIPTTGTVSGDASDEYQDVTITKPTITGTKASNYTLKDITGVKVKINKIDSNIGAVSVSSHSTIYNTTELKNIVLEVDTPDSGTKTAGTATLDAGQTLQVGTHEYAWTFTPSNSNYKTKTGKVSIAVVQDTLTSIQLKDGAANYKMAYLYGDAFNLNGAIVQAVYSSGATKDLAANELTYSEEKLAVGQTTETISYTENGVTKNLELGITVDKASHGNVTVIPTVEIKFGKSKTIDLSEYIVSGGTLESTVSFDDTQNVLNRTETKVVNENGTVQIATVNDQTKAGKKGAAKFTVESANYEDYIITVDVTILDKFALTVTPPQAVASLVYNGSAQELITPAKVAETGHGTIEYKLGENGTYGTALPTATDASSSYIVYYKVTGDNDYADVAEQSITATIAKKEASVGLKTVTITKGQSPTFELEWSGLVGNDTATISGAATPSFTLTDAEGKAVELDTAKNTVGTYKITWSNPGAVAFSVENNYNVTKNTEATLTVTEAKSYGGGSGSSSSSKLETAKNEAKSDVKTQTESQKYEDTEAAEVKAIKEQADKDIAAAKTVEEVEKIKAEAEAKIEAVPTAEEKAEIAKVSGVNKQVFIATSKKSTLHGKKAVKVSWVLPKGIDVDGFVVYRSTKKGSFGTKPYFTTKNSTYKNNKELKTGTTYYYKVKGYKVINGEKVYTGWSTTAWRTC